LKIGQFSNFMLIDTHAHLNLSAFDKDRDFIIKKCLKNNIGMINVGTNYETSRKAVEIAQKYQEGVFAAIGLHPINLDTGLVKIKKDLLESTSNFCEREFDYEKYERLAQSSKVVAIGEIGLDYYWKPKTTKKKELFKKFQKDLLTKQLKLANEFNLPIIFHCRMAHAELSELLKSNIKNIKSKLRGVMHGFVGTLEELKSSLKLGLYIGFNGIIFKKIEGIDFKKVIFETPLQKILIETDCPYLTPPTFPEKRNNPLAVKYILKEISEIKKISQEDLEKFINENARNLFNL